MEPLQKYFGDLDVDFVGLQKVTDDTYIYNATDVLVQSTWELPIVIQWPESTVKFEFTCAPTEITFGIVFVAAPEEDQDVSDLEIETIEEMTLMSSENGAITGTFEVPCEGVIFFLWDNKHDWYANKKISYLIEVMQPSFTYVDQVRLERVLPAMKDVVEDLDVAFIRHADAQDCIEHSSADVAFLDEQIATLQSKLDWKRRERDRMEHIMDASEAVIELGYAVLPGVAIRTLNKHLMTVMLGYLSVRGGANSVCRYWAGMMADNREALASGAEPVFREPKMSRREVRTMLLQIKFAADERARKAAASKAAANKIAPANSNAQSGIVSQSLTVSVAAQDSGQQVPGGPDRASDEDSSDDDDASDAEEEETDAQQQQQQQPLASPPTPMPAVPPPAVPQPPPPPPSQQFQRPNSARLRVSFDDFLDSSAPRAREAPQPSAATAVTGVLKHVLSPEEKSKMAGVVSSGDHKQQYISSSHQADANKVRNSPSGSQSQPPLQSRRGMEPSSSSATQQLIEQQSLEQQSRPKAHGHKEAPPSALKAPRQSTITSSSSVARKSDQQLQKAQDRSLLQHVKKIRSDQQLAAMLEYIQAGFLKIEGLATEKRRIKKLIRAWNASFQKRTGRMPTGGERKGHLRELYEEYQQVSLALRIRTEKMDEVLLGVGLDRAEFEKLRDKHNLA